MENTHKWYELPLLILLFIVGVLVGMMVNIPTNYNVDFGLTPEFYRTINTSMDKFQNWTNMCCFPSECEQSKNNPKLCTCEYMVKCFKENVSRELPLPSATQG